MPALILLCVPPPLEPVERAVPFATLTPAQAADLAGKVRLYKVALDSASTPAGARFGYDLAHDDEPAVRGSAYVDADLADDVADVSVRGVLVIVQHPRRGGRGQFGGFVEYRLVGKVESAKTPWRAGQVRPTSARITARAKKRRAWRPWHAPAPERPAGMHESAGGRHPHTPGRLRRQPRRQLVLPCVRRPRRWRR